MIITIKNEEGEISYDVNNIKDEGKQGEARVIIQKVENFHIHKKVN